MDDYDDLIRGSRLNTFLELKMENEQLQQRLANLRKRAKGTDPSSSSTYRPPSPSMAPTMNSSYPNPPSIPQRRPTDKSQYYPSTGSGVSAAHRHNGIMPSPVNCSFEAGNPAPHLYGIGADEESSEERTKKKVCLLGASLTDSALTPLLSWKQMSSTYVLLAVALIRLNGEKYATHIISLQHYSTTHF